MNGDDKEAEELYFWHIETRTKGFEKQHWKSSLRDFKTGCVELLNSMQSHRFLPQYAVDINQDGVLLTGAHRLSCAIAINETAYQRITPTHKTLQPWDAVYLKSVGADDNLLKSVAEYVDRLKDEVRNIYRPIKATVPVR